MEPSSVMEESPIVEPVTVNLVKWLSVPLPPTDPPEPAQLPVERQIIPF